LLALESELQKEQVGGQLKMLRIPAMSFQGARWPVFVPGRPRARFPFPYLFGVAGLAVTAVTLTLTAYCVARAGSTLGTVAGTVLYVSVTLYLTWCIVLGWGFTEWDKEVWLKARCWHNEPAHPSNWARIDIETPDPAKPPQE
jgi:hypothetical protein